MEVLILVGVVAILTVAAAASLRARTERAVLAAAVSWLLAAVLLALLVVFDATPCGPLSGQGFLTASPQCPVQPVHIVDAVVGGSSFASLLCAGLTGLVYGEAGVLARRRTFRIALLVAMALLLALIAADVALPRQHPSD